MSFNFKCGEKLMHIVIIGPNPPCIRCRRILRMLREIKSEEGLDMEITHVFAGSDESEKYGRIMDSHIFLESLGVNTGELDELFERRDFKGIDEWLAPYVEEARKRRIMLTPVVVVNGKVKTVGVVPEKEELKRIIKEEAAYG
ncbi:MAG: thioredoxin family protein [Candidatus Jordarchaeales archaeon]